MFMSIFMYCMYVLYSHRDLCIMHLCGYQCSNMFKNKCFYLFNSNNNHMALKCLHCELLKLSSKFLPSIDTMTGIILSKQDSRVGSPTTDSPPTCFFSHSESVWPVIQVAQTLGQVRLDGDAVQWEDVIVRSDTKDRVHDNVAFACLFRVSGDESMTRGERQCWLVLKSKRHQPRAKPCEDKEVSKPRLHRKTTTKQKKIIHSSSLQIPVRL